MKRALLTTLLSAAFALPSPIFAFTAEPQSSDLDSSDAVAARARFLRHQPGAPVTHEAARAVEEGCALPCRSAAEVAAYLNQIDAAGTKLGLCAAELAQARDHYAPAGVPRKKAGRSDELGRKALDIAAALGAAPYASWDGGSVQLVQAPPMNPLPAPPIDSPAKGRVLDAAPPNPAAVDQRLAQELNAGISRYPTGKALLRAVSDPIPVTLKDMQEPDTLVRYEASGGNETFVINTQSVAEALKRLDPAGSADLDLADPAILRRRLAAHPALLTSLASVFDVCYVHEMTHAAQYRRSGTGRLNAWKDAWIMILNWGKYPMEDEWEAFGMQNLFFHEKALADPSVLDARGPLPTTVFNYQDYIGDLARYRRNLALLYISRGETQTLDKLRLHGRKEKDYYRAAFAREESQWPRLSIEGFILRARYECARGYQTQALPLIKTAHDRAAADGLSSAFRAELGGVFKTALAGFEERLARFEKEKRKWTLYDRDAALINELNAYFKASLPPRVAKVLKRRV